MDGPRSDLRAAAERATPAGELRAVPLWQVFGSDELSGLSAPIVERTQRPFVVLNPADAATLGVAEGEDALVSCGSDDTASLRVLVNAAMAAGHVGYARGLPGSVAHAPASLRVQADPSAARMIART
jgi:hypothetical protein